MSEGGREGGRRDAGGKGGGVSEDKNTREEKGEGGEGKGKKRRERTFMRTSYLVYNLVPPTNLSIVEEGLQGVG